MLIYPFRGSQNIGFLDGQCVQTATIIPFLVLIYPKAYHVPASWKKMEKTQGRDLRDVCFLSGFLQMTVVAFW